MKISPNMMLQVSGQDQGARTGAISEFMDGKTGKGKEFFSALEPAEKRFEQSSRDKGGEGGFKEPLARLESLIAKVAEMNLADADTQKASGAGHEKMAELLDQAKLSMPSAMSDMGEDVVPTAEMLGEGSVTEPDGLDAVVLKLLSLGKEHLAAVQETSDVDRLPIGVDVLGPQESTMKEGKSNASPELTSESVKLDVANRIEALTQALKAQQQTVQTPVVAAAGSEQKSAAAEMMDLVARVDKQIDKVTSALQTAVGNTVAAQIVARAEAGSLKNGGLAEATVDKKTPSARVARSTKADPTNLQAFETKYMPVDRAVAAERVGADATNVGIRDQHSSRVEGASGPRDTVVALQANGASSQNAVQNPTTGSAQPASMAKEISAQLVKHLNTELLTMELRPAVSVDRTVSVNTTTSVLTLQLHPVGLGRVQAEIRRVGELVKIKLTVEAPDTLEIIKSDLDSLKNAMRALGTADGDVTLTQGSLSRLTSDSSSAGHNLFSNERQSNPDLDERHSQSGSNRFGQSYGDEDNGGKDNNSSRNSQTGNEIIYI